MAGVTLDGILLEVGAHYPITNKEYPYADLGNPGKALRFAMGHSHAHLSKSVGRLAGQLESADHGAPLDRKALQERAASLLISVLNMAHKLDLGGNELAALVHAKMNE